MKQLKRTACVAWGQSPNHQSPLLASGTLSGAVDASFNTSASLQIHDLDWSNRQSPEMKQLGPSIEAPCL